MKVELLNLRLKNLRSITDSTNIEIKPITLLVGKNSAGKSTFARVFPLLRQSAEAKKRSSILWYSANGVDFGSFLDSMNNKITKKNKDRALAKYKHYEENGIEFTFKIKVEDDSNKNKSIFIKNTNEKPQSNNYHIHLKINWDDIFENVYTSHIEITSDEFSFIIKCNAFNIIENIEIDGHKWNMSHAIEVDFKNRALIPELIVGAPPSGSGLNFNELISQYIKENSEHISDDSINTITMAMLGLKNNDIQTGIESYKHIIKAFAELEYIAKAPELSSETITKYLKINKIASVCQEADDALKQYFSATMYIEPLRATAQRFYRNQDLSIDEVDSQGKNLAMYLSGLRADKIEYLNAWLHSKFGFKVNTKKESGHTAIVITDEKTDEHTNIADMGFGYSQVLPILVQTWIHVFEKEKIPSCTVIEQPELHLHPAYQAKLADAFASMVNENKSQKLIIETHSNHIINKFGTLIADGKLSENDIQILIFEKSDTGETKIEKSTFDNEGYLKNWPIGFFQPEV